MSDIRARLLNDTKARTGEVRLSYEHLMRPYAFKKDQEPKYTVSAIISKDDKETLAVIEKAIDNAVQKGIDKFGKSFKSPRTHLPLKDGDVDRSADAAYEGAYYLNCSNAQKPAVFDEKGRPVEDETVIYSGCRGSILLQFYPYNAPGNIGVGVSVLGFMKTRDDEPLGGAHVNAKADFGIEDEEDDFLS